MKTRQEISDDLQEMAGESIWDKVDYVLKVQNLSWNQAIDKAAQSAQPMCTEQTEEYSTWKINPDSILKLKVLDV